MMHTAPVATSTPQRSRPVTNTKHPTALWMIDVNHVVSMDDCVWRANVEKFKTMEAKTYSDSKQELEHR